MGRFYSTYTHYCRWCNKPYKSKKPHPYSGFCSTAHKQAHHRAYKKYVTAKIRKPPPATHKAVTRKRA